MAKASFEAALARVLAHEGGYSNHPSDPGGPTNFGITLADYRKYAKPNATAADVRAMKVEEVKAIYRAHYWDALRCDDLPAGFDYALFDYGVNSGTARAARIACSLVGARGHTLDDAAIAALGAADSMQLIERLCDERLAFLRRLKTWPVFGRGWSRRVSEVRAAALAMARAARASAAGAQTPPAPAPGKGHVPLARGAQRASAGAIMAGGAIAAAQAHSAGAPAGFVAAIALAFAAVAVAAWVFWSWRRRRRQVAVGARTGPEAEPSPASGV